MLLPAVLPSTGVGADTITTFSDGAPSKTLDYIGPGKKNVTVTLPNDADIERATFDMIGEEMAPGNGYPFDLKVDIGEDGSVEWGFGGTGIGYLGHQPFLSNGATSGATVFTDPGGGTDTSLNVRLPKFATVEDANIGISGNGSSYHPFEGDYLDGPVSNGHLGWAVEVVGDVNDDGWDDLVIGIRDADMAELYHGGPVYDDVPDLVMSGGQWFGQAIAGLGDVNDDTIDDFAIAENGTVRIYFGGPGLDGVADFNLTGEDLGIHYFGISLAGGSDLDADGHPDIVVGDYFSDVDYSGRVYVFNGGPGLDNAWDYHFNGSMGVKFGNTVATGGDLDKDGWDELVIATPSCYWNMLPGEMLIYKGGPGFGISPLAYVSGPKNGENIGLSMDISEDFNGDGIDDLMAGAPTDASGRVYFVWGRASWPANPPISWTMVGGTSGEDFGYAVSYIGDTDHDGRSEMVVGAPSYDESGNVDSGTAYLINGTASPSIQGSTRLQGFKGFAQAGYQVDGLGDIDGDGDIDLALSAPGNNSGRGTVVVYMGRNGLGGAKVKLGGVALEGFVDGPVLNGSKAGIIPVAGLQDAINVLPITYTDEYDNPFVDLVVSLEAAGAGELAIDRISINYTPDTSSVMHLEDGLETYLASAREAGTPGAEAVVPISIESGGRGRLVLSDLVIDLRPNGLPSASIDPSVPASVEAGEVFRLMGYGADDGTVVKYEWSSDLEGVLGQGAGIEVPLNIVGTHVVSLRVQDDKGVWSPTCSTVIIVVPANLPPLVWVDEPAEDETVHGTVMISGGASDPNAGDVLRVEVSIENREWEEANGSSPWTYQWDTSNEIEGNYSIDVRAWDGDIYSPGITVNVTVLHAVPGMAITAKHPSQAHPGDQVTINYTLRNTGTGEGDFSISAIVRPAMEAQLSLVNITLDAGEEDLVVLTLSFNDSLMTETYVIVELVVEDVQDRLIYDSETVRIKVIERPPDPSEQSVVLDGPPDGEGRPGEYVTYGFIIKNTGTATDSYEISAVSAGGWKVTMKLDESPYVASVPVAPGRTVLLEVLVDIPSDAKKGMLDKVTITVRSTKFELVSVSDIVQTKVLQRKVTTEVVSVPWVPATATFVFVGVIGSILGGTEWGKYGFFWLLIPLYSRLKKEAVLDNFKRGEINAFIKLNPGTYYNEIKKHLGVSNGVLTYHLNRLEREGYVRAKVHGRYKHYFPADMKVPKNIIILNEVQRGLLTYIRDSHGVTQAYISEHFDIPVPTVSRHLKRLVEAEMVTVDKRGNVNYYVLKSDTIEPEREEYYEYDADHYARTPPEQ